MTPFLCILFIALLGFAMGLGLILFDNTGDFHDVGAAILAVFNYGMIGEYSDFHVDFSTRYTCAAQADDGTTGRGECSRLNLIALGLFVAMMILVNIVSLNLLIAIMSDSYQAVRENSVLEYAYEKAKLLLNLEITWLPVLAWLRGTHTSEDTGTFPRWLHVLRPLDDDADEAHGDAGAHGGPSHGGGGSHGHGHHGGGSARGGSHADVAALEAKVCEIAQRLRPLEKLGASLGRLEESVQKLAGSQGNEFSAVSSSWHDRMALARSRGKTVADLRTAVPLPANAATQQAREAPAAVSGKELPQPAPIQAGPSVQRERSPSAPRPPPPPSRCSGASARKPGPSDEPLQPPSGEAAGARLSGALQPIHVAASSPRDTDSPAAASVRAYASSPGKRHASDRKVAPYKWLLEQTDPGVVTSTKTPTTASPDANAGGSTPPPGPTPWRP